MTTCLKCGTDTPRELCDTCNTTKTIRTELEPHLDTSIAAELADKLADLLKEQK
ncbi:hypothetical protein HMPREF1484_00230 [Dermabacter sp. HFH0086]|uniref:hypothetical protein n=1 Tax=Dermabacter TaxID=36739 RepID=UPI00035450D3|nr:MULTISPECIES: hypothetical protein [Dermabacter]EPH17545.1 hypothetical protein HMPREF1484_00230 [Dermabacter sp. HFH0086]